LYIPNFIEIGQGFCGWTYGRMDVPTDRRTFRPLMLLKMTKQWIPKHPLQSAKIYKLLRLSVLCTVT